MGEPGVAAPVAFWPKDGAEITDVRVVGEHAADARVRVDECTNAPVVAGEACTVYVRFTPSTVGVRRATLRATDAAGRTTDVPLEIFAHGGDTSYQVTSTLHATKEGLRPIMPPGTFTYDTKANYDVGGDPLHLQINFLANLNNAWTMHFLPPPGETLKVGHYADAHWYRDHGDGPGMSVTIGIGCQHLTGEFTVHDLERTAGIVTRMKLSFEIFCPEFTGSLRGTFAWRAGDTTPLAPWMVSSAPTPTVTATAAPTATPSAAATATPTPFGTAAPSPTPSAPGPSPRAAVQAKMKPCLAQAGALARTSPTRRRAVATRFAKRLQACRREVAALPSSSARSAALSTLRRHASAARTLRAKGASVKAVRRARTVLRTG